MALRPLRNSLLNLGPSLAARTLSQNRLASRALTFINPAGVPVSISHLPSAPRRSTMSAPVRQPEWKKPVGTPVPELKIYNSMTKSKEDFVPVDKNQVSWYCCGPTVYDKSHMGHARAYITFDILRRLMEDYFKYDVLYVMNITDIDDKIIRDARYKFLFESLRKKTTNLSADVVKQVEETWHAYVAAKFKTHAPKSLDEFPAFAKKYESGGIPEAKDELKYDLFVKTATRTADALKVAQAELAKGVASQEAAHALLDASRDVVSVALDAKDGHTVTDPKIFRDFAAYWEEQYFVDMDALNIRRPDVLTRVSEYVPEIATYIEKIVANGFAYEADGSVYFNTVAFGNDPNHDYAKLEPWSAGNAKLIQEGEGDLTGEVKGKRHPADFALWKKSKAGEPAWPSKWGEGRPGWHIECSVMASDVIGEKIDIHTGGIDLAFPHHDNELAQAEAHYNCDQWVNYFIHAGHLHIEGQKMSKSLKNFVTIQEALQKHTAAQIRLMFLLHSWDSVLDFSTGSLHEAKSVESSINNLLANVKAVVHEKAGGQAFTGAHDFREQEKELMARFRESQNAIHAALCDSFNTPQAFVHIRELVGHANQYYQRNAGKAALNADLLAKVAQYLTKLMRTFGVFPDANPAIGSGSGGGKNLEDELLPYLRALSSFRDAVRDLAQNKGDHKELLKLCDRLRDEDLVELGVVLDDRDDGKALVKLVNKETLIKQRDEKRQRESAKLKEKEDRAKAEAAKRAEKLAKGKLAPADMFKTEDARKEFSEWDDQGLPTKDAAGELITKSRRKKLEKEFAMQAKLHEQYLAQA
ncbi:tRNA synthetases class I (C) catalytic domain-containing protein [Geranomyces variabilis]|nr:tRNA synthetases class I (C) catalytic domain-containing protein [Geranomyces variabilis]